MNSKSFIRKIIYIALIGALLIPLSLVSRPATVKRPGQSAAPSAGRLAELREQFGLSQTRVSEIDPTSETMKLLSLGLRGVAVNLLWLQAMENKRVENFDQLETTLNALIKIQPNFVKVWEYQAHNLSYNISMEFDDFESRYHWVKKGIRFLTGGIPYNLKDHRITDNLGMFTGMKIGNADEKVQYRRLFRKDSDFHEEMSTFIEPDLYDTRQFGHDHWLMAYYWYDLSRIKVEEQSAKPYTSDLIFYMKQPAQKRNQAMWLQREFRSNESIKNMWLSAKDEWIQYGQRPLKNSLGLEITLNAMSEVSERVQRLRDQLDEMAPGTRNQLVLAARSRFNFTESDQAILNKPADQRTDEENARARSVQGMISNAVQEIDVQVFQQVPREQQVAARDLLNQILLARRELSSIDRDQGTSNYVYWQTRNEAESEDQTLLAHQQLFDASEQQRKSIFDDEYQLDTATGERKILRRGAITSYLQAFTEWARVMEKYPRLQEGELADTLVESMQQFQDILKISGTRWPMDFPLQSMIDLRSKNEQTDALPTTEELEEERSAREEAPDSGG